MGGEALRYPTISCDLARSHLNLIIRQIYTGYQCIGGGKTGVSIIPYTQLDTRTLLAGTAMASCSLLARFLVAAAAAVGGADKVAEEALRREMRDPSSATRRAHTVGDFGRRGFQGAASPECARRLAACAWLP